MIIKHLRPSRWPNLLPAHRTLLTGTRSCSSPLQSLTLQVIGCIRMPEVIHIFRRNPSASEIWLLLKAPSPRWSRHSIPPSPSPTPPFPAFLPSHLPGHRPGLYQRSATRWNSHRTQHISGCRPASRGRRHPPIVLPQSTSPPHFHRTVSEVNSVNKVSVPFFPFFPFPGLYQRSATRWTRIVLNTFQAVGLPRLTPVVGKRL